MLGQQQATKQPLMALHSTQPAAAGSPKSPAVAGAATANGRRRGRAARLVAAAQALGRLATLVVVLTWIADSTRHSLGMEARALRLHQPAPTVGGPPPGYCRHEYTLPTWAGELVPVCDWSVCRGRERLAPPPRPPAGGATPRRRWREADAQAYWRLAFEEQAIAGWLNETHVRWVDALTGIQHAAGVLGSVGEIGVQHGKFFLPILGMAAEGEPAVAIDLFDDLQGDNVDGSGSGSRATFLRHVREVGIDPSSVRTVAANSMALAADDLAALGLPPFRLLSVDGGHSLENTLHDLMLAACVVADGGIVVLDDFPNPEWQGVIEALVHFSGAQTRLRLLLVGYNKAYFTTTTHWPAYVGAMQGMQDAFGCRAFHASRRTLAGGEFCFGGPEGEPGVLAGDDAPGGAAPAQVAALHSALQGGAAPE